MTHREPFMAWWEAPLQVAIGVAATLLGIWLTDLLGARRRREDRTAEREEALAAQQRTVYVRLRAFQSKLAWTAWDSGRSLLGLHGALTVEEIHAAGRKYLEAGKLVEERLHELMELVGSVETLFVLDDPGSKAIAKLLKFRPPEITLSSNPKAHQAELTKAFTETWAPGITQPLAQLVQSVGRQVRPVGAEPT